MTTAMFKQETKKTHKNLLACGIAFLSCPLLPFEERVITGKSPAAAALFLCGTIQEQRSISKAFCPMGACREADASTVHEYNEDLVRKPTPQPLRLFSLMGGQRVWFATGTSTKIAGWSWFAKAEVVRLLRCNSSPYEATHVEHILEVLILPSPDDHGPARNLKILVSSEQLLPENWPLARSPTEPPPGNKPQSCAGHRRKLWIVSSISLNTPLIAGTRNGYCIGLVHKVLWKEDPVQIQLVNAKGKVDPRLYNIHSVRPIDLQILLAQSFGKMNGRIAMSLRLLRELHLGTGVAVLQPASGIENEAETIEDGHAICRVKRFRNSF